MLEKASGRLTNESYMRIKTEEELKVLGTTCNITCPYFFSLWAKQTTSLLISKNEIKAQFLSAINETIILAKYLLF